MYFVAETRKVCLGANVPLHVASAMQAVAKER